MFCLSVGVTMTTILAYELKNGSWALMWSPVAPEFAAMKNESNAEGQLSIYVKYSKNNYSPGSFPLLTTTNL